VTARSRALGLALAVAALWSCLDGTGPDIRQVRLAIVPVFSGMGTHAGGTSDVDSFVIDVDNPPLPPQHIVRRIPPGQDTIQIAVVVDLTSPVDTVLITFSGYSSTTGLLLYSGSQSVVAVAGLPTTVPVTATYVGPGQGIDSVLVSPAALSLAPGDSAPLTVTGYDVNAAMPPQDVPLRFASADTAVARVSAAGVVRAVAVGTTRVYATSVARSTVEDTAVVTVTLTPNPAIGLSLTAVGFTDTVGTADPAPRTVTVSNTGGGALTGLATGTITYGAGATGWLTASLNTATAPATLTLTASNAGLAAGSYTATVPVTSGVATNSPQTVTVTYTLSPGPLVALNPTAVTFTDTVGTANPPAQTVAVTNAGTGTLTGLATGTIAYGPGATGWLTATVNPTTAPATVTLTPSNAGLAAGSYTATVPVTAGNGLNNPQTITVTYTLAANPPAIALSPASHTLTDTLATANPAPLIVNITNAGGGTLSGLAVGTISYGPGATGWLTGTINPTTAPTTLSLQVSLTGLTPGTFTATVPVTAPGASNSPQNASVTLTVVAALPASIAVTPGFGVIQPGGTLPLAVSAKDANGNPTSAGTVTFTSRNSGVATVNPSTGVVTGVAGGSAVIVATSAAGPADSMAVAVGASGSAVVSAIAGTRAFDSVGVGDTVRVLVQVDLSGVAPEKLGSYNDSLGWDPAVLTYVSNAVVGGGFAAPTVNTSLVGSGILRFGAADANGAAGPVVGLIQITFVAQGAGSTAVAQTLSDLSAAGTFTQMLPQALVVGSQVRVQ